MTALDDSPLQLRNELRLGVALSGSSAAQVRDTARRVEASGFDSIWVGDHVAFHVPIFDSLSLLSFMAGATESIALGTSVYLMPLRHPTTTAKQVSTLDQLSAGRVLFGIGVGGEFPPEFEACGVPVSERGSRTNEGIDIIRKLWSEDKVEHAGRHFEFGPVTLAPKPVQPGGPPIIVGGRKTPSMRRAGQLGDGYISHMCSAETYASNLESIAGFAREAEREVTPFHAVAFLFTIFDESYGNALDRAAKLLQTIYNVPFRDAAQKYCLLGRPEDCMKQLQRFIDAGCRHFVLTPLMDSNEFLDQAESQILPGFRKLRV
jgi:probable F420-dependent oxidoreductase